jgi:hypothetical protein
VSPDAVELLVDQVSDNAARSGRAAAGVPPISISTTRPERAFLLTLSPTVTLNAVERSTADALALPAEALIRLVAGRLDPDHTPGEVTDQRLVVLREAFPGF